QMAATQRSRRARREATERLPPTRRDSPGRLLEAQREPCGALVVVQDEQKELVRLLRAGRTRESRRAVADVGRTVARQGDDLNGVFHEPGIRIISDGCRGGARTQRMQRRSRVD